MSEVRPGDRTVFSSSLSLSRLFFLPSGGVALQLGIHGLGHGGAVGAIPVSSCFVFSSASATVGRTSIHLGPGPSLSFLSSWEMVNVGRGNMCSPFPLRLCSGSGVGKMV